MTRRLITAFAALALAAVASPGSASAPTTAPLAAPPAPPRAGQSLPAVFVDYFFRWKSQPRDLKVSELKVLDAGGGLRVLCGAYALGGQAQKPFLVLGDASPSAAAAWEPGSFPDSDPLYPQLMDNLRLCRTLGVAVTSQGWRGDSES